MVHTPRQRSNRDTSRMRVRDLPLEPPTSGVRAFQEETDPVISSLQRTEKRRWLLPFLGALVAALAAILLGTTASASATVGAETRVGALNVAAEVPVGPPEHIAAGQRLGNNVAGPGIVVATGVAANTGNRVFWSGGQPAKEAAEAFAKANGSKTLEMTAVGRTLEKLPYNRFTAKLWDAASAGFTVTARGNANVFIGPSFRGGGSTFGRIEGPILNFKGNPVLQRFGDVW